VDLNESAMLDSVAWTHYSSIELESGDVENCIRQIKAHGPYQLVTVGSLAQLYKGTDVLIESVARCVRAGFDVTAAIVGDGKYRLQLMAQAERMSVSSRIRFLGHVPAGEQVRSILDGADLFVLPSRTEGLPRAMIEAMARALPCIGSAVGGIPELLDGSDLVPPGDAAALADKIQEVLKNPLRMEAMSRRNLVASRDYLDCVLDERRRHFYRHVRDYTERWEATRVS
jgi:glycosyltransferase involved in cell wall biosynthesis